MRNVWIIIKKQWKDTLKNKTILIQFVMVPVLTLVMERAIHVNGMPELFFTKLFSVMYIGMAPLTSVAAILSEEKEKNTLRVLMNANVKAWQYLLGVGVYVWCICMIGAFVMSTGIESAHRIMYLCLMGMGLIISILAGACVGIFAKSQMSATSLVIPTMMVLAFAPMLAMFNENIAKVAKVFYTQQIRLQMNNLSFANISWESVFVLCVNAVILVVLFGVIYRRKGLE